MASHPGPSGCEAAALTTEPPCPPTLQLQSSERQIRQSSWSVWAWVLFIHAWNVLTVLNRPHSSSSRVFLNSRSRKESPSSLGTTRAKSIMASWCTTTTDSSRRINVSWVCACVWNFNLCLVISSYTLKWVYVLLTDYTDDKHRSHWCDWV